MSRFSLVQACVGLLALGGLLAAAAEIMARLLDCGLRVPIYAGGAAGLLLVVVGLPFAAKLTGVATSDDASFWKWWGTGLLTRMILLLILALALAAYFSERRAAALLSMISVYLIGMFVEAAWLAKRFFSNSSSQSHRGHRDGME
ncbi:MAG: hypothetical protein V1899_07920 [Planctomycetota bacterium]